MLRSVLWILLSVSTMYLENTLLISVCLMFLSSLKKIIREEDSSLALEIIIFMMVLL